MSLIFKIFLGFWTIWILWYFTGGPLRDDASKPFIRLNPEGQLEPAGKDTVK